MQGERTRGFWGANERAWRSELYDFRVVWHEQRHEFAATLNGMIVGALRLRIAASLAHVEALFVLPEHRRRGVGRALLTRAQETSSYYNCHKVTLEVPVRSAAAAFFEACAYRTEAILPQHTFKLDIAVMRTFLL
ncbi:MAG TPA: GNAT family N-acetyltransferase [Candidatus Baltobacteraceae bacterium]